jgi:hypothetical protein
MPVILKWLTSAPSAALRLSTRPLLDCVSSSVVALVTEGVSAVGVMLMVAVAVAPPSPPSLAAFEACASKEALALRLVVGVNFRPAWPSA